MRSPDPVNWTVPLDTGKTFTVTQNIREGDIRPHSEMKVCTPITDQPPLPSASAPPELAEQAKLDGESVWNFFNGSAPNQCELFSLSAYNRPKSNPTDVTKIIQPLSPKKTLTNAASAAATSASSLSVTPVAAVANSAVQEEKLTDLPEVRFDKPVAGSTLRCLEDPIFGDASLLPTASNASKGSIVGSNELEGRDRFDRFWGGGKDTTTNGNDDQKTAN